MCVGWIGFLTWVMQEDGEELVEGYGVEGEECVCHEVYDGLAGEYFDQGGAWEWGF
jgi:hypothetical protein